MVENARRKVIFIAALLLVAIGLLVVPEKPFRMGLDLQGGTRLEYRFDFDAAVRAGMIDQAEAQDSYALLAEFANIIRERIDPNGILEASIRPEGTDRIVIEIPSAVGAGRVQASAELGPEGLPSGRLILTLAEGISDDILAKFPVSGGLLEIGGSRGEKVEYGSRDGRIFDELRRARQATTQLDHPAGAQIELIATDPIEQLIENPGTMFFFVAAKTGDFTGTGTDRTQEEQRVVSWLTEVPGRTVVEYNSLTSAEGGARLENLLWFPDKVGKGQPVTPPHERLIPVLRPENDEWRFTGGDLARVYMAQDEMSLPAVGFEMKGAKKPKFGAFTEAHIGDQLAIVLNDEVVVAPTLQGALTGQSVINGGPGGYTTDEVNELISVLRSGSLRIKPVLEQKELVGATLGDDYVRRGALSAVLGLAVVLLFMVGFYRRLGIYASLSLFCNLVLLMGAMAFLKATLTLPGVAGIILTVGMAVDANILIYERMREERKRGRKIAQAAKDGFDNAVSAIVDANLTTLLTAIILYNVGTGPVRGFATTLIIGILTTMFSALVVTRLLVHMHVVRGAKEFGMAKILPETRIPFQRYGRPALAIGGVLVLASILLFFSRPDKEQLSIDFLGGSAVTVRTEEPESADTIRRLLSEGTTGSIAEATVQPLLASGTRDAGFRTFRITAKGEGEASPDTDDTATATAETQIARALGSVLQSGPVEVAVEGGAVSGRIYFEGEHPIADIVAALSDANVTDPVVESVANAPGVYSLQGTATAGMRGDSIAIAIENTLVGRMDTGGLEMRLAKPIPGTSVVGAQVVGELRDKAILAILFSLLVVVLYIRVRFAEYSYGFAAVAALVHDVMVTLGAVAIANWTGLVEAEVGLTMVAAFLTIIGYSLNDTIIIFDRVRENRPRMKGSLEEIVDLSINQTLSRTILTSGTTLCTVTILFILNYGSGSILEGFAFALIIGMIAGTISTVYIAGPVFIWLERRALRAEASKPEQPPAVPRVGASV